MDMRSNRSLGWSFALLLLSTALAGCKRDKEEEVAPTGDEVHTVDLRLKFVFQYGTHDYEIGSEYTDAAGRIYRLDTVRFLLSNLHVIDDELNVLANYPDVNLLVDAASPANDFALGVLTAAHAHQIRFNIGLDPALNNTDPGTAAAPLNDPAMYWGSGADEGYWFLVLEGVVDSDNNGVLESTDSSFSYRCGTDALMRSGWARMHTALPDGGSFTIETDVDVEQLMAPLDIAATLEATGGNALNVQLMDSLTSSFNEQH